MDHQNLISLTEEEPTENDSKELVEEEEDLGPWDYTLRVPSDDKQHSVRHFIDVLGAIPVDEDNCLILYKDRLVQFIDWPSEGIDKPDSQWATVMNMILANSSPDLNRETDNDDLFDDDDFDPPPLKVA